MSLKSTLPCLCFKAYQEYAGNIRLATLIDCYRNDYFSCAGRFEKYCISQGIVTMVKETNGRFLQRSDSDEGWVELGEEAARAKVSHGYVKRKWLAGILLFLFILLASLILIWHLVAFEQRREETAPPSQPLDSNLTLSEFAS
jgi:hypothetical protein